MFKDLVHPTLCGWMNSSPPLIRSPFRSIVVFLFFLPLKFLWFRENSAWNDSKREALSKWWLFALSVLRSGESPACRMKPCSFSSVSLLTQQAVPASHNVLVVNEWQRWQTNRSLKKKKKRNKSRRSLRLTDWHFPVSDVWLDTSQAANKGWW